MSNSRQYINQDLFQSQYKPATTFTSSPFNSYVKSKNILDEGQQENSQDSNKVFPLFEFNKRSEKWEMNKKALEELRQVAKSGPIKCVSVVGAYRLGKSYLMNQIMHCKKKGFELGHTTESKTKGVWASYEVVNDPINGQHVLICLDSEGLLDVDRDDESFDMSLFCILTMLSSYMIINLEKRISSDDLNKLAFASSFTEMLITDQEKDEDYNHEDIQFYTPQLLWLVRDFTLKLKGTEQEYLEDILSEDESRKKKSNVSLIKENIKKYFGDKMELKTLPCPSSDEEVLTNIEENQEKLSEKFVKGMESLVEHIRNTAPLKKILSPKNNAETNLSSVDFYRYCESLVVQLNDNARQIQIPNTFETVIAQQLETIQAETMENYDLQMRLEVDSFPVNEDELLESHVEVLSSLIPKSLIQVPHFKREEFHKKLMKLLGDASFKDDPLEVELHHESRLFTLLERNKVESDKFCEQIYTKEIQAVKSKVHSNVDECRKDLEFVRSNLAQQLIGPSTNKYLTKFFSDAHDIMKQTILYQKIHQAEKEKELLKAEVYRMNEERKLLVERIEKERIRTENSMQMLKKNQELLQNQIQQERQANSERLSLMQTQLNQKPVTPTVIYQPVATPSYSSSGSSSRSRASCYSSSDDDDYYCSSSRRSSGGGRSGKTFYKGGQFIPGGGRAPKGGVWM